MAKKKTTANYRMGDLVVVKSTDWDKNVKYESFDLRYMI